MAISYTPEQRLQVVKLRYRHENENFSQIMHRYNASSISNTHPMLYAKDVKRIVLKFEETFTLLDAKRIGRPKSCTDEYSAMGVIAAIEINPHMTTREISRQSGMSQWSVCRILKENRVRPYKLQVLQRLFAADRPKRIDFCYYMLGRLQNKPDFLHHIVFSDEATLFMNDVYNRQNYRYWSKINPHWFEGLRSRSSKKLNIWTAIFGDECIGPFFLDSNICGKNYLLMLKRRAFPAIIASAKRQGIPVKEIWFQHDGAPAHWRKEVRDWLDTTFPQHWIGRNAEEKGGISWPPRSPDFAPMDFFAWGILRQHIFLPQRPATEQDLRNRVFNFFQDQRHRPAMVTSTMLHNVRESFIRRLHACLDQNGGHFEHRI